MRQQPFASPEEALEHYGTKGMRWGVRKQNDTSGRDTARKEVQSRSVVESFTTSNATPYLVKDAPSGRAQRAEVKDHKGIDGLSDTQKKVLIGAGVVTVGAASYFAYKHYVGGGIGAGPGEFNVSELNKGPLSKVGLNKLDHGHSGFKLDDPELLRVDLSRGYANIIPVDGFGNETVARRHSELVKTFEEMREKYPAVRNLNVEIVPMSHAPGMESMTQQGCPAAVQAIRKGEARIFYNDILGELEGDGLAYIKEVQPGQLTKDFLGYHEMGHVLAVANGNLPPSFDTFKNLQAGTGEVRPKDIAKAIRYKSYQSSSHKRLMKKHGLTFKELSKLSRYGATEPAEALAELSGYFHTPEYRAKMDPALAKKAEALFADMGGLT